MIFSYIIVGVMLLASTIVIGAGTVVGVTLGLYSGIQNYNNTMSLPGDYPEISSTNIIYPEGDNIDLNTVNSAEAIIKQHNKNIRRAKVNKLGRGIKRGVGKFLGNFVTSSANKSNLREIEGGFSIYE